MKKKIKQKISNITEIPEKIHEIISYLAHSFNSKILEEDDIIQDLYLLYLEMIKKDERAKTASPGYFFIKFKWYLKTKYKREVNRRIKEWEYVLKDDPHKSRRQSRVGYLSTLDVSGEEQREDL